MKSKNYIAGFEAGKLHGTPIQGVTNMNAAKHVHGKRKEGEKSQD